MATFAGGSGANALNFSGTATGNGTMQILGAGGGSTLPVSLNSTANTFTGPIVMGSVGGSLTFNSLPDAATPTPIYMQSGSCAFVMVSGATANVALTNRYIQLGGNNLTPTLNNVSTTKALKIFSDLQVTGTGTQTLTLYGATGPTNELGGVIGNGAATVSVSVGPYAAGALTSPYWYLSNTNNTFTGQVTLGYGSPTLIANNIANAGSPSSLGKGGTIVVNGGGNGMASLIFVGAGSTTDRGLQIGGNNSGTALLNNGTGALTFTATTFNPQAATASAYTLTLGGSYTGSANQIQGTIQNNNAGAIALTKTGGGTWVLSGTNTYTGATTVSAGKLFINGNQTAAIGAVTVLTNATLGGTGTIGAVVRYQKGALASFTITPTISDYNNSTYMTFTNAVFMTNVTVKVDMPAGLTNGIYVLATNYVSWTTNGSLTFATNSGSLGTGGSGSVSLAGKNLILTVSGVTGGVAQATSIWSYSNTGPFAYDGTAKTPTISFSGSTGTKTTNYVGTGTTTYASVNAPTNVGTYYVSNTVVADVNYYAATNSQAFTIKAPGNFSAISVSGTALTLTVTNGTPFGPWTLLQSTNMLLPVAQWSTNRTGAYDGSGNLTTNIVNAATNPAQFYLLK